MKKILLITTTHTGCGHKSISDSMMDWFCDMPEVEVVQVDGFEKLVNRFARTLCGSYGIVTRHAKFLWAMTWAFGSRFNGFYCNLMTLWARKRFMRLVQQEKPDVVITTHPMFNSSLLNVCEREGLRLPFVSVQADPVTIHKSWCDPRSEIVVCATEEAVKCTLGFGVPREKIRLVGFPTRRRFTDIAQSTDKPPYDPSRPARCLMMSGGEGSGKLGRYALAILKNTDVHLTIVCGRNKQLKLRLETLLKPHYGDRIDIKGFVNDMENVMLESDILIARGSPNTFFEGIVMNVPLIITGALPGQEQGNPDLVAHNNLGIVCETIHGLPDAVKFLLKDDGRKLQQIRSAQQAYRRFDNARRIAEIARAVALGTETGSPPEISAK